MSEEKNEKRALVPRLRFPEFRDAGEWETVPMGSLLVRNPEYGVNAPAAPYSEDLPTYLRITDIDDDGRFLSESKVSVDIVATDDNYLESGDIVLARTGASVGKSYRYRKEDGRLVFAGFLIRIRPEPKKVNSIFLANFLTTQQYWSWVGVTSARSGQPGINGTEYSSLPVPVPSNEAGNNGLSEQQRIADCLFSLNELIAAEGQKLGTLRTYKKGLMQQLFPRESETLPRLRFSKFQNAGEWQKRKISTLLNRSINPVDVDAGAMYQEVGIRSHGKGIFHKELVSGKSLGTKRVFWVKEDAFVVNIVFAWEQAVAVTSAAEKGMIASHRFPMYTAKPNKTNVNFIKYFFLTKKGKELLGIASPGGAGRNKTLGQKEFENLEFLLPSTVEEQNEIANFLSSIDTLIAIQSQKVDALKNHRNSLMQQLFPMLNEVGG